jgi:hypothetical protein
MVIILRKKEEKMVKEYHYKTRTIPHMGPSYTEDKKTFVIIPECCPMCHSNISPIKLYDNFNDEIKLFTIFYECPKCKGSFIAYYKNQSDIFGFPAVFDGLYPKFAREIYFDKEISELSPMFVEIYNQATEAETYNLDKLAGMGYRRSLEFLIKDFCISKNPEKEEDIKKNLLGKVINTYIDNTKIKNLAKVSAWIGNDETHYNKHYDNLDIADMKKFIEATVHFISYDLLSDIAEKLVTDKND